MPRPAANDATTRIEQPGTDSSRLPQFRVSVVGGAQNVVLDATRPRILVGQSPICELRLADSKVSRRHLALEVIGRGLKLVDLGSTNRTFVSSVEVIDAVLYGGEQIEVGDTTLVVEALGEGPQPPTDAMRFGRMIGASPQMRRLYPLCERLAKSDVPVVLEGETGCGKELLAESLHEAGNRAQGPFVVFDCTAVPATLMESQLFGHEKGAFTGATATHRGVFEQAHKGTLLIDEIGDLDLSLQAKLLRVIERAEVKRLGAEQLIKCDVRLIAATRRDLDQEVQANRFRDDLFFRLAVARLELPPLRERASDIPLLCRHFWRQLGGAERPMPAGFIERCEASRWPGNVRELRNVVARTLALGDLADQVTRPAPATHSQPGKDFIDQVLERGLSFPASRDQVQEEFERRYVERVLALHGGQVARAAAASGIARRYFQMIRARSGG